MSFYNILTFIFSLALFVGELPEKGGRGGGWEVEYVHGSLLEVKMRE